MKSRFIFPLTVAFFPFTGTGFAGTDADVEIPSLVVVRESVDTKSGERKAELAVLQVEVPRNDQGEVDQQQLDRIVEQQAAHQQFVDIAQQHAASQRDMPPEVQVFLEQQVEQTVEEPLGFAALMRYPRWTYWQPYRYYPGYRYPAGIYGYGYRPYFGYNAPYYPNYGYYAYNRFYPYTPVPYYRNWGGYNWSYFYR